MPRRGENIRKRKDGRWEARLIVDYDSQGKARYYSVYGRSYKEVRDKKKLLVSTGYAKISIFGSSTDSLKTTMEQVMYEWLNSRQDSIKESTYAQYYSIIEKHILPELGSCLLSSITSEHLDSFLRDKLHAGRIDKKGGLSPKTVSDIRSIILQGLEYAKQHGYPCAVTSKIFYPKTQQPSIEVLSRAEQEQLEEILFQNPDCVKLGILIALYGGLRIGELCALKWEDLHFESGTVKIDKTLIRIRDLTPNTLKKTKLIIDRPKTNNSNRIIPLPSFIILLLKKYKKSDDCYVLTGTPMYLEPRILREKYKLVLKEAKLHSFTFHALRHTFATRCVESNFDIKSLSEILGHSNVSTTLQKYVHPSMELKREQMNRLEMISIQGQKKGHKSIKNVDVSEERQSFLP